MKERLNFLSVLLMVLSLSLCTISCSKEDKQKETDSIVGVWKFKSVSAGQIRSNNSVNDEKIKQYIIAAGTDNYIGFWFDFKADGTVRSSYQDEPALTGTYIFRNGMLTIKDGEETYSMKATVDNGTFLLERDYAEDCNDLEMDQLIELGITDPVNFLVTKAIAQIGFSQK